MRLRRFTGADTASALRRVKEALGADVVILQTRACAEGGVEITAAVDVELVTPPLATATTAPDLAAVARHVEELGARPRRDREPSSRWRAAASRARRRPRR